MSVITRSRYVLNTIIDEDIKIAMLLSRIIQVDRDIFNASEEFILMDIIDCKLKMIDYIEDPTYRLVNKMIDIASRDRCKYCRSINTITHRCYRRIEDELPIIYIQCLNCSGLHKQ